LTRSDWSWILARTIFCQYFIKMFHTPIFLLIVYHYQILRTNWELYLHHDFFLRESHQKKLNSWFIQILFLKKCSLLLKCIENSSSASSITQNAIY
jgi:hypothetical protein